MLGSQQPAVVSSNCSYVILVAVHTVDRRSDRIHRLGPWSVEDGADFAINSNLKTVKPQNALLFFS